MKKIIVFTFLGLIFSLGFAFHQKEVEAYTIPSSYGFSYDNDVWEPCSGAYSDWRTVTDESDYGSVTLHYRVLRNAHEVENYVYYLIMEHVEIALYEENQTGNTVWWSPSGYKDLWLNAGIMLRTDVNQYMDNAELYEYSPQADLQEYSYSTSTTASLDFGLEANSNGEVTTSLGVGISATASTSWSTDGRYVENFSLSSSDVVKTVYRYDVLMNRNWQDVYNFDDLGLHSKSTYWNLPNLAPDKDLIDNFQQSIVERQSYVVKVPKRQTLLLNLEVYYVQLYFDEAFLNHLSKTYFSNNKKNVTIYMSSC